MQTINFDDVKKGFLKSSAVTVGNFDGVHVGHREIIGRVIAHAGEFEAPSVVVTFDPHPREVIYRGEMVPAIIPFSERARLISELGVDYLARVDFTLMFAARSANKFVEDLVGKFAPKAIVIGHDFHFGKDREGDEKFLVNAGKSIGFEVEAVPFVEVEGKPVHSTEIRHLIQAGKMKRARAFLGAPFHVEGEVVKGHGRGKGLGFATANIRWEARLIPPDGVYAAVAEWNGERFPAVVNIGDNPTFEDEGISIEAHIMGFEGDIYERRLRIAFYRRLRGEVKFNSKAALIAQIREDVKKACDELKREAEADVLAAIEKHLAHQACGD